MENYQETESVKKDNPGISRRSFLQTGSLVTAAAALGLLGTTECKKQKDSKGAFQEVCKTNLDINFENNIPGTSQIKLTNKPVKFEQPDNLLLPETADFSNIAKKILEFTKKEVEGFRKAPRSYRAAINFTVWLNRRICNLFEPATNFALNEELEKYMEQNDQKEFGTWVSRLNQYLLTAGFLFVGIPRIGKVQILKVSKSFWMKGTMGEKTYDIPTLYVEVPKKYENDRTVAGHSGFSEKPPMVIVNENIIRTENKKTADQIQAFAKKLNLQEKDVASLMQMLAKTNHNDAVQSVAQHEGAHYILFKEFGIELINEGRKPFVVKWKGEKTHGLSREAFRTEAEEIFAIGTQIVNSKHNKMHLLKLMLGERFKDLVFLLSVIASIPNCKEKEAIIKKVENINIFNITKDEALLDQVFRALFDTQYKDEHAKKAGELYLKTGYDFFLQNNY